MDARELTKVVENQRAAVEDLSRKVNYLEQVIEKLELRTKDMEIDVKMLQKR